MFDDGSPSESKERGVGTSALVGTRLLPQTNLASLRLRGQRSGMLDIVRPLDDGSPSDAKEHGVGTSALVGTHLLPVESRTGSRRLRGSQQQHAVSKARGPFQEQAAADSMRRQDAGRFSHPTTGLEPEYAVRRRRRGDSGGGGVFRVGGLDWGISYLGYTGTSALVHGQAHEDREREVDSLRQFHDRRDVRRRGWSLAHGACVYSDSKDGTLRRPGDPGGSWVFRTGVPGWGLRCEASDGDDGMPCTSDEAVRSGTPADIIIEATKAASDFFLARGRYEGVRARLKIAIEMGLSYWVLELKNWFREARGLPREYRPRVAWSWLDIMGCPLKQDNGSCTISACLMCLDAQHRLTFERQHGVETFPYRIPLETAKDLVDLCTSCSVWTEEDGADEGNVLEVLRITGGAEAESNWPGWEPRCKLQVKSWHKMLNFAGLCPWFSIAYTLDTKGPLLGSFVAGSDYYDQGWETRVYRGGSGDGAEAHLVVCFGYTFEEGEMHVRVVDNHEHYGPLRWILYQAFTVFTRIEVEVLDAGDLRKKEHKTSRWTWWRGLLSKLRREKQQPSWRLWRYALSGIWKIYERDFLLARSSS